MLYTIKTITICTAILIFCGLSLQGQPSAASPLQGGEDWTDAFEILSLPFSADGTTVGYDWNWPNDSTPQCPVQAYGPDVFYSFTPSYNMLANIDLCGSDSYYDNMLVIIDQDFNQIDCRDDDYSSDYWINERPCGEHTARLSRVPLQAGINYFIIVTGYGDGNYQLYMNEDVVVPVVCPPDAIDEGEPPIVHGYLDDYNSGCTGLSPDSPIQHIDIEGQALMQICANSGWFYPLHADTDWYSVELGTQGALEVNLESERSTFLMHLSPPECEGYNVEQWCLAGYGETCTLVISGSPGQIVWLVVAPRSLRSDFWPEVAEYTYLLSINSGVVGVEETSWGSVKALYR